MKKVTRILLPLLAALCLVPVPAHYGADGWGWLVVLAVAALFMKGGRQRWYMHTSGGVNVTLANGELGGSLQTNDGVMGLVITGNIDDGGYTLGTPILITGLSGLADNGITRAGNNYVYRQVQSFYGEAGSGAQLYLMVVPNTMTVTLMATFSNENGAIKLLNYAQGKIKVIGLLSDDDQVAVPNTDNAINSDVYAAATLLHQLLNNQALDERPARGIIGGTSFTGASGDLIDQATGGATNRVAIVIGDTQAGTGAAVGLTLGRLAKIPVQAKLSRVKDGILAVSEICFGAVSSGAYTEAGVIRDAGYITFTTYPNRSGYYFSGDPMAVITSDDYYIMAQGRVIDKAQIIAYQTFLDEVDDDIPTVDGGKPDQKFISWLKQQIVRAIEVNMISQDNCSGVSITISPDQDVISTRTLNAVLKIRPKGYLNDIEIKLGFTK